MHSCRKFIRWSICPGILPLNTPQDVQKLILIDAAGLEYNENTASLAFKIARIPIIKNIMTFITPKSLVKKRLQDVYYDKSKVKANSQTDILTLRSGQETDNP